MDALPLDEPLETLGQRVRGLRSAAGISQLELARRVRVSQPRISQIERNQVARPLPHRTLCDLADGLGVELADLIAGDPIYRCFDLDETRGPPAASRQPPRSAVSLIGRADDVAAVADVLRSGVRLLTLTGPGGVGKTQLALRVAEIVADDFPDGVAFVPLAACVDPASVIAAIARATGLRERDARPLRSRLLSDLPSDPLLLILDNVEQAVSTLAPLTMELLAVYPNLRLLLTSQVALGARTEHRHEVAPLGIPDTAHTASVAAVAAAPAVELFVQRARDVNPEFTLGETNAADVAATCARLDGLPLAIELAAARSRVFAPAQLLRQLDRRLAFLASTSRDLPARQRSLRASIEWSVGLLAADQQTLLRRLAVFAGSFTLEAASAVAGVERQKSPDINLGSHHGLNATADGLTILLDHHLLTRGELADGTPRFGMLETIQEYAAERLLASGEADAIRHRHLHWAVDLAERGDAALFGFAQEPWLDRLDADWKNIQAALQWVIETGQTEAALRLAAALTDYWYLRGMFSEGTRWLDRALALPDVSPPTPSLALARVRALAAASQLAQPRGDLPAAVARADQGLTLARKIGDRQGEARALALTANHALVKDDLARAAALHRTALAMFRDLGADHRWIVAGLNNLSLIAYEQGNHGEASTLAQEALHLARQSGDSWGMTMAHQRLGDAALALERFAPAADHITQSLLLNRRDGLPWGIANAVAAGGSLAVAAGCPTQGIRLLAAASGLYQSLGVRIPPKLRPDWTRTLQRARTTCGAQRFAAAWETGAHLSVDDAVRDALAATEHAARAAAARGTPNGPARRRHRVRANVLVRKSGTQPRRA